MVQLPGGGRNTLTCDGDGKRRRIEDSQGLRDLIWDGENVVREQDANNLIAAYTLAPEVYGAPR